MFPDSKSPEANDNEDDAEEQETNAQEKDEECDDAITAGEIPSTKALSTPHATQQPTSQVYHPGEKKEQRRKRHADKKIDTAESHVQRHSCKKPHAQDHSVTSWETFLPSERGVVHCSRSCLPFNRLLAFSSALNLMSAASPEEEPYREYEKTNAIPDNLIRNILGARGKRIIAMSHSSIAHMFIH